MPYVERDEHGTVKGCYASPQPEYAEEWLDDDDPEIIAFLNPATVVPKQMLGPISAATLTINWGEVLGVETSVNFALAFAIDVDKYWVLFTEPEPDTNYLVLGNVPFIRNTEFIEITAQDPSEVSLTTWRVQ